MKKIIAAGMLAIMLSGCASATLVGVKEDLRNKPIVKGALIGAVLGAGVGAVSAGIGVGSGALVGAGIGAGQVAIDQKTK